MSRRSWASGTQYLREAYRNEPRIRCTTHSCTVAAGHTTVIASGRPVSPSQHTMHTSATGVAGRVIAVRDGQQPRLIYRVHDKSRRPGHKRKGFTETDYARLLGAAHQQLGGAARAGLGLCSAEHNPSSVPG